MTRRVAGLWTLVVVLAALGFGTITNQVRINNANAALAKQAADGAASLARSCRLAGVSRKAYTDMLQRNVITADDFALFASTLQQVCSRR